MTPRKAGILYLVLTIAVGITGVGAIIFSIFSGGHLTLAANFIIYPVMLGVCLFFMFISKESPAEFFGFKGVKVSTFFLTILFAALIYPITNIIAAVSNMLFGNPLESLDDSPMGVMVVMVFLCAPFFEELVFRGAVFRGFRNSGRVAGPILMSAFLFGLFHGNPTQFFYTGFLGIFLGLVADATGSLWMPVLVHFLFNFTGIMIPLALEGALESSQTTTGVQPAPIEIGGTQQMLFQSVQLAVTIVIFLVVLGIALILMFLALKLLKRIARIEGRENVYLKPMAPKGNSGQTVWSISLVIGILLSVGAVVTSMIVR